MRLIEFLKLTEAVHPDVKVKDVGDGNFKAYLKGKYVGYVSIYNFKDREGKFAPDERYIWKAVVKPGFKRTGIGTALYNAAEEWLNERGLKLVPSPDQQLSDEAYAFWQKRNPDLLKHHARTLAIPFHKHVGKKITYNGRPAEIIKALSDKAFKYQYTDVPEGSVNSQGAARWERIQDQLTEQRLIEAFVQKDFYYWVLPNGRVIETDDLGGHAHAALEYFQIQGDDDDAIDEAKDLAYENGWLRAAFDTYPSGITIFEVSTPQRKPFTPQQIVALIRLVDNFSNSKVFNIRGTEVDDYGRAIGLIRKSGLVESTIPGWYDDEEDEHPDYEAQGPFYSYSELPSGYEAPAYKFKDTAEREEHKFKGGYSLFLRGDNVIEINQLWSEQKGAGTAMMSFLTNLADKLNVILTLRPEPYDTGLGREMPDGILISWYYEYDFESTGHHNQMARIPEGPITEQWDDEGW